MGGLESTQKKVNTCKKVKKVRNGETFTKGQQAQLDNFLDCIDESIEWITSKDLQFQGSQESKIQLWYLIKAMGFIVYGKDYKEKINYEIFNSFSNDDKILFLENHYGIFGKEQYKDYMYERYQSDPQDEFSHIDPVDRERLKKDYENRKEKFKNSLNILISHGLLKGDRNWLGDNKELEEIKGSSPGFSTRIKEIQKLLKNRLKTGELSVEEKKLISLQVEMSLAQEQLRDSILEAAADTAGIFDPFPTSDLIATSLAIKQGNYFDAGVSLLGIASYIGDFAKSIKAPKAAKKLRKLTKKIEELTPKLEKAMDALKKVFNYQQYIGELKQLKEYENIFKSAVKEIALNGGKIANDSAKNKAIESITEKLTEKADNLFEKLKSKIIFKIQDLFNNKGKKSKRLKKAFKIINCLKGSVKKLIDEILEKVNIFYISSGKTFLKIHFFLRSSVYYIGDVRIDIRLFNNVTGWNNLSEEEQIQRVENWLTAPVYYGGTKVRKGVKVKELGKKGLDFVSKITGHIKSRLKKKNSKIKPYPHLRGETDEKKAQIKYRKAMNQLQYQIIKKRPKYIKCKFQN